ncbi:MAG: hypothetical protein M1837_004547 [Sclerophora amabilis]|nr:MAG: hypothetical protein M1837_004547 [Sclerophora amabilis]
MGLSIAASGKGPVPTESVVSSAGSAAEQDLTNEKAHSAHAASSIPVGVVSSCVRIRSGQGVMSHLSQMMTRAGNYYCQDINFLLLLLWGKLITTLDEEKRSSEPQASLDPTRFAASARPSHRMMEDKVMNDVGAKEVIVHLLLSA